MPFLGSMVVLARINNLNIMLIFPRSSEAHKSCKYNLKGYSISSSSSKRTLDNNGYQATVTVKEKQCCKVRGKFKVVTNGTALVNLSYPIQ